MQARRTPGTPRRRRNNNAGVSASHPGVSRDARVLAAAGGGGAQPGWVSDPRVPDWHADGAPVRPAPRGGSGAGDPRRTLKPRPIRGASTRATSAGRAASTGRRRTPFATGTKCVNGPQAHKKRVHVARPQGRASHNPYDGFDFGLFLNDCW